MLLFLKDVVSELKKLTIPSKKEVYITTVIVLVVVAVSSVAIIIADFLISQIIKILFGL